MDPTRIDWDVDKKLPRRRDGQVCIFVRSLKFNRSTGFQHARETIDLVRRLPDLFKMQSAGRPKPIMIINVDSGPDEHPTHYASIMGNCIVFISRGVQLLVVASLAAGFSSDQEHEQSQSFITQAIAGTVFEADHFGKPV